MFKDEVNFEKMFCSWCLCVCEEEKECNFEETSRGFIVEKWGDLRGVNHCDSRIEFEERRRKLGL